MVSSISSKKRTKTRHKVVKTNSFVRFLEEFMAWQFAFEINWPLVIFKKLQNPFSHSKMIFKNLVRFLCKKQGMYMKMIFDRCVVRNLHNKQQDLIWRYIHSSYYYQSWWQSSAYLLFSIGEGSEDICHKLRFLFECFVTSGISSN